MNYKGDFLSNKWIIPNKPTGHFVKANPGNLDDIITTIQFSLKHIEIAIESAKKAYPIWKKLTLQERIAYLKRFQIRLNEDYKDLSEIISREVGKPLWEAEQEVNSMVSKIDVSIHQGLELIKSFKVDNASGSLSGICEYHPRGVMAILGPFNFPGHLPNGHIVPALLTGNTVIFKPSELTPITGQKLAEIIQSIGLPDGVFNMIQGDASIGSLLVSHSAIDGVLFTGSYKTGLAIKRLTLEQPWKILALEMGGKNSTIIMDDADLDFALSETLFSCLVTTGQRCSSTSKIILHSNIAQTFMNRFKDLISQLKIGNAFDVNKPFMGPLINQRSMDNYIESQKIAINEGHEEIIRGSQLSMPHKGYYISPSAYLVSGKDYFTHYQTEEIFAPNIALYIVNDLEYAIEIANASPYRLVTSLFSLSEKNFKKLLEESNSGLINWNKSTVGASSKLPFGGGGRSGNHFPTALFASYYCTYPVSSLINPNPNPQVDFSLFTGNK